MNSNPPDLDNTNSFSLRDLWKSVLKDLRRFILIYVLAIATGFVWGHYSFDIDSLGNITDPISIWFIIVSCVANLHFSSLYHFCSKLSVYESLSWDHRGILGKVIVNILKWFPTLSTSFSAAIIVSIVAGQMKLHVIVAIIYLCYFTASDIFVCCSLPRYPDKIQWRNIHLIFKRQCKKWFQFDDGIVLGALVLCGLLAFSFEKLFFESKLGVGFAVALAFTMHTVVTGGSFWILDRSHLEGEILDICNKKLVVRFDRVRYRISKNKFLTKFNCRISENTQVAALLDPSIPKQALINLLTKLETPTFGRVYLRSDTQIIKISNLVKEFDFTCFMKLISEIDHHSLIIFDNYDEWNALHGNKDVRKLIDNIRVNGYTTVIMSSNNNISELKEICNEIVHIRNIRRRWWPLLKITDVSPV